MPVSYQIVPEHLYPHQHVQINDNTEVTVANYSSGSSDLTALLCVFASPKGRDREIYTIENGLAGFMSEYGLGPFSIYGQPLLNAYAAASTNACKLHCLRVTANDATYAHSVLYATYSTDPDSKTMTVKLFTKPVTAGISDRETVEDLFATPVVENGATTVPLMVVTYIGRGSYGNSIRWRLTSDRSMDKNNDFKNYSFSVYTTDDGMNERERHSVSFFEDALYAGASIYTPDVINDKSNYIRVSVNHDAFADIFAEYLESNPDTYLTQKTFDPLLGIDKETRTAIEKLVIEAEPEIETEGVPSAIALNSAAGVSLEGGDDGALSASKTATEREAALKSLYEKAFGGEIDPYIKSKNRFPTTFIMDANYPVTVKQLIASLALTRTDCMAMLDCGLEINTKASVKSYIDTNLSSYINNRVQTIEAYCEKVRDPYSQKIVTVTGTYWLASAYPNHIYEWEGKHRPLAGNRFGKMSGFIKNSVYPLFDEDLDSVLMDELAEMHVNFAKYNANQEVCRAMQDTRQKKLTALSEQNNMLIVLDVKRDAERIAAANEYDFSDPANLMLFNMALEPLTQKYSAAQVQSITATYSKNDWENQMNYIHLNIAMFVKGLVRTTIIEIDVNRS